MSKKNFNKLILSLFVCALVPMGRAQGDDSALLTRLLGSTWEWVELTDPLGVYEIKSPERYNLVFTKDGRIQIQADCNRAVGNYTADEEKSLSIKVGPMTRARCSSQSKSEEFIKKLGFVTHYFFKGNYLFMDMMADGGTFRFRPAGPKEIAAQFTCEDGSKLSVLFKSGKKPNDFGSVVISSGDLKTELPQVISGSGARYKKGRTLFWNKGEGARYQVGEKSTYCTTTK